MMLRPSQIIRLSLKAADFNKLRTASLARDMSFEDPLLRYIAKDYSNNGDSMEAHLDAKNDYLEARIS